MTSQSLSPLLTYFYYSGSHLMLSLIKWLQQLIYCLLSFWNVKHMGPRQSDHNNIKHNHIKRLQLNLHFCFDTFFDVAQWFLLKKTLLEKCPLWKVCCFSQTLVKCSQQKLKVNFFCWTDFRQYKLVSVANFDFCYSTQHWVHR